MLKHTEKYLVDVITKKKKGVIPFCFRVILCLLSWPYALLTIVRNWVFDQGYLRRYYPSVPVVISIGNIVVGGTGKTPVTLMVAKEFYPDYLIAILSRGYRSKSEKLSDPVVLSCGNGPVQSPFFCGDEPFLLAQNLPKAMVIVGRDRHKSSIIAAREGAQILLLDDGMQHRRLARDFDIVVMDSYDLFGQGHFLPRGLLRESVSSLGRAHLVILNHIDSHETFIKLRENVAKYTQASVVGTRMEVAGINSFNGEVIDSLEGKKVGIFCGIAHPDYFRETVRQQGAVIVNAAFSGDHREFGSATLRVFAQQCKDLGAELLVCTEKDKVKIADDRSLALPIVWLQMKLNVVEGADEWYNFISKVKLTLQVY